MDERILEGIRKAFQKEDAIRSIDLQDISVTVEDGHIFLNGHVANDLNFHRMEDIARSIIGVVVVHNHLVADHGLSQKVAQSLAKDERLQPLSLPVLSTHGWISLSGEVPTPELQHAAEAAAARVPMVRGVVKLPKVIGEAEEAPRLVLQPPIGARVCGENGHQGVVYQVIIRPQNRLVTHAVVRVSQTNDGRQIARNLLVPLDAMDVVGEEEIILKREAPALNEFRIFIPGDYPIAPLTWMPPYPYQVGKVRWTPE
ncbi:MAG TPA: BON domain-containing protein [Anaerolineaceae bacterium]|nr:BON domain-containing protein [Anaerolineaceae bacterium]